MKYWEEGKVGHGYEDEGLIMSNSNQDRILSVSKTEKGFLIMEECDAYYRLELSKEETLELIDELRSWVENQ